LTLKRQVRPSALGRWQKSRMFRAVMTIATMGVVITGGLAAPATAHASLIVPQGPAAAEDEFGAGATPQVVDEAGASDSAVRPLAG
jgi:hypothetical protein